jgi:hypothetical protein
MAIPAVHKVDLVPDHRRAYLKTRPHGFPTDTSLPDLRDMRRFSKLTRTDCPTDVSRIGGHFDGCGTLQCLTFGFTPR